MTTKVERFEFLPNFVFDPYKLMSESHINVKSYLKKITWAPFSQLIERKSQKHEMDKYANYNDLKQHEREGKDYVVILRESNSRIAVIAPHGGGIEPGTAEIADVVAGAEHTFYAFKGIKKKGNAVLHITSNRFDEPKGVGIAKKADVVISIHGHHGNEDRVYIGGRNRDLKLRILHMLNKAGF